MTTRWTHQPTGRMRKPTPLTPARTASTGCAAAPGPTRWTATRTSAWCRWVGRGSWLILTTYTFMGWTGRTGSRQGSVVSGRRQTLTTDPCASRIRNGKINDLGDLAPGGAVAWAEGAV